MPGSIQVSVLGLMDLPSAPPLSSLTLKVAVGKREYHIAGGGELSFPVLSLRENLIVALNDAEGEEVLRTEFKTMLLLERGFCDNLVPLRNGGSLHMKLHFSLSEEDQKRVRDMRDSALKKRQMENHKTKHRRSLSDNRIGAPITKTIFEISTKEMPFDHSEITSTDVGPYLGQKEKFHASGIHAGGSPRNAITGERHSGNLKSLQTIPKSFSSGMLSQINSKGKSNLMESFVKKSERHNVIPATNYGTLGSKNLKIDKKNSKVHIGIDGIKSIYNTISHADPSSSAPFNSSMTVDNVQKTDNNGESTVLVVHAGTSGERKNFTSVIVEKGYPTGPLLLNFKAVGEKQNLNFMQEEVIALDLNATSDTLKARPSLHSGAELCSSGDEYGTTGKILDNGNRTGDRNAKFTGVNKNTETMVVYKNNNEQQSLRGKFLPLDVTADELEKVQNPNKQSSLVEDARTRSDDNTSQNPSNKVAAIEELSTTSMKCKSRNESGDGHTTSEDASRNESGDGHTTSEDASRNESGDGHTTSEDASRKTETADAYEINNEEHTLRDGSLPSKKMVGDDSTMAENPYLLGTSVEVARTVYDEIVSQIPSDEHHIPENSYKKAEESESDYSLVSPIEILDTWMPRHLCITTGSNLLRDFVESFTFSTEVSLNENSAMKEADTKKYGDAYLLGNEGKVSPSSVSSCSENSSRSLKSNGGLIERVVRIVVVIVACGILLKSR